MLRRIATQGVLYLTAALVIGGGTIVRADDDIPGPKWMTIEQAVQALRFAGYTNIAELEAEDGRWKGKAVRGGVLCKVRIDPRTGAVTERLRERRDDDN